VSGEVRREGAGVEQSEAAPCVANIGPLQRRKRSRWGAQLLAATGVAGGLLVVSGAARGWRGLLLAPFWAAALGVFQARAETCVALARRGLRDMDTGPELIRDAAELSRVRRQAGKVYLRSFLLAAMLTAVLLTLPRR
jgi:hypothetical protein